MNCDHCYCKRVDVGGLPHAKCCNCGHQKLVVPSGQIRTIKIVGDDNVARERRPGGAILD